MSGLVLKADVSVSTVHKLANLPLNARVTITIEIWTAVQEPVDLPLKLS